MKILTASIVAVIVVFSLVSMIDASRIDIVLTENEALPLRIAYGNYTPSGLIYEPFDMCVSETGLTFVVSGHPERDYAPRVARTSFIAWNRDSSVKWTYESDALTGRVYYGVATDESYVYVTGADERDPFLTKYDYQGNEIWNVIWDTIGQGENLVVTEDGTIVVGGYTGIQTNGWYLKTFDTNGQELWHAVFQHPLVLSSSSNFIYTLSDMAIQKYQTSGTLVWSTNTTYGNEICAKGNTIYTLNISKFSDNGRPPFQRDLLDVTRWDATTGAQLWKHDIRISDVTNREYSCTGIEYTIDQSGTLVLLMETFEHESWYLSKIASNGTPLNMKLLLDNSWSHALIGLEESGDIHIAGFGESFDLGKALFHESLITVPIPGTNPLGFDILLVGGVVAGVALFDISLILYWKKKHPRE